MKQRVVWTIAVDLVSHLLVSQEGREVGRPSRRQSWAPCGPSVGTACLDFIHASRVTCWQKKQKYRSTTHAAPSTYILDVVVRQRTLVLQRLAVEEIARHPEALLVGRDTLLVLDLALHAIDPVGRLRFQGDGLARAGFNKDLHATAVVDLQMEGGVLQQTTKGEQD